MKKIFCLFCVLFLAVASRGENVPHTEKLSPPAFVDESDLEETMKIMGKSFRQLKTAQTTAEMHEPMQTMLLYAKQAQAIGLVGAKAEKEKAYRDRIQLLRLELKKLETLIKNDDFSAAKQQIDVLNKMRQKGHREFKYY